MSVFLRFVQYTEQMLKRFRPNMDIHLLPQMDLCGLDEIKYDFVGYLEKIESEKDKLLSLLRLRPRSLPPPPSFLKDGGTTSDTNLKKKLKHEYSRKLVSLVRDLYTMDVYSPFNNITFQPPYVLRKLLSPSSGNLNS